MAELYKDSTVAFAATVDGWSGPNKKHYLGVTVHWIDAKFKMKKGCLDIVECGKDGDSLKRGLTVRFPSLFLLIRSSLHLILTHCS